MTAPSYLRTRRRRLAWLVLPALLMRALIPAGFMPMGDSAGLSIGLCPGAAALLAGRVAHGTSHPAHAHAQHAGGDSGAAGTTHHTACLFATGASAAFAAALCAPLRAAPARTADDRRSAATIFIPAIWRSQSPRAPPLARLNA